MTFFGETARMPAGPAMLAALTGAYLCPTDLSFTDRTAGAIRIHPPMTLPGTRLRRAGARRAPRSIADDLRGRASASTRSDWHMLQPLWLADRPTGATGRPEPAPERAGAERMRVGLVCPYSFDIPGGVQAHVADLAEDADRPRATTSRCWPRATTDGRRLPPFVVPSGRSVPIPYNGSVARLSFGPVSYTGSAAGSGPASSTCCTCTSRSRRACRCSR